MLCKCRIYKTWCGKGGGHFPINYLIRSQQATDRRIPQKVVFGAYIMKSNAELRPMFCFAFDKETVRRVLFRCSATFILRLVCMDASATSYIIEKYPKENLNNVTSTLKYLTKQNFQKNLQVLFKVISSKRLIWQHTNFVL